MLAATLWALGLSSLTPLVEPLRQLRKNLVEKESDVKKKEITVPEASVSETDQERKDRKIADSTYTALLNISDINRKIGGLKPSAKTLDDAIIILQQLNDALFMVLLKPPSFEGKHSFAAAEEYRSYLEKFSQMDLSLLDSLEPSASLSAENVAVIKEFKQTIEKCPEAIQQLDAQRDAYIASKNVSSDAAVMLAEARPTLDSDPEAATPIDDLPQATAIPNQPDPIQPLLQEKTRLEELLKQQNSAIETQKEETKVYEEKQNNLIEQKKSIITQYDQDPKLLDLKLLTSELDFFSRELEHENNDRKALELISTLQQSEHFNAYSEEFKNALKNYSEPVFNVFGNSPTEHLTKCFTEERQRIAVTTEKIKDENSAKMMDESAKLQKEIILVASQVNQKHENLATLQNKVKTTRDSIREIELKINDLLTQTPIIAIPIDDIKKNSQKTSNEINMLSTKIRQTLILFLETEANRSPFLNILDKNKKATKIRALIEQLKATDFKDDYTQDINQRFLDEIVKTLAQKRNPSTNKDKETRGTRNFKVLEHNLKKDMQKLIELQQEHDKIIAPKVALEEMTSLSKVTDSDLTFAAIHKLPTTSQQPIFQEQLNALQTLKTDFTEVAHVQPLIDLATESKDETLIQKTQSFIGDFYYEQLPKLDSKFSGASSMDFCIKSKIQTEASDLKLAINKHVENHVSHEKDDSNQYIQKEKYGKILAYSYLLTNISVHAEKPTKSEATHIAEQLTHYQTLIDDPTLPENIKCSMQTMLDAAKTYIQTEEPEWATAIGLETPQAEEHVSLRQ